jgi:hypothetical protein
VAKGWGTRRISGGGALLGLVLLVGGCSGGSGGETPTPTPQPTVAVTPTAAPEPISLGPIVWTTAVDDATGEPEDDLQIIPHDAPAIIAAIETGPLPAGTELTGEWTMNGVAVPGGPVTVRADEAREAGWVTFAFKRNEGATWPPGVLELTVTAADGESVTGSVQIRVN